MKARQKKRPEDQVEEWNARVPLETVIRYHPVIGNPEYRETKTRSKAFVLSGHTACVFLQGESGCVALDACEVAPYESFTKVGVEYAANPPLADNSIPREAQCQEASAHSWGLYVPCRKQATTIVHHPKDRRSYYMCDACADHNLRNRGGKLVASKTAFIRERYTEAKS
jgi:hypothetical protein